jgi:hypothetical protein
MSRNAHAGLSKRLVMDNQTEVRRIMVPHGISLPTAKLIEKIKDGKPGDVLSDADLTAACGRPTEPEGSGYANLMSAISYVRRMHGVVWERVRAERCIKCLNPKEILSTADASAGKIRRESMKSVQKLRTIVLDNLEESERPAVLSRMAQHGTLAQFAKADSRKKFEAGNVSAAISPAKMLELLK